MSILARYLVASYFRLFAAAFSISILVLSVVELLVNFDKVFATRGLPAAPSVLQSVLSYLFLRIPSYYLRDVIPVSSFAAAFLCLGLPARRSEITAARAGGISLLRLVVPVLLAAGAVSALALIVNETIVLDATRSWSRLGIGGEKIAFQQGTFWYRRGDRIYNIWDADRATHLLRGVRVYELDARGRLARAIRASSVSVESGDRWEFSKPVVHSFEPDHPERGPRIEALPSLTLEVGSRRDLEILSSQSSALGVQDLLDSIAVRRAEGHPVTRYRTLLQRRLSDPLAPLILALLAIAPAVGVERTRNLALSAVQGLLWMGAFQAARVTGNLMLPATLPAAAALPWAITGAFAGIGLRQLLALPR